MTMTIIQAIDILAPHEGGSVDSGVAYEFAMYVNNGKAPATQKPKTHSDRLHNRACSYAREYIDTGKIETL